MPHLVSKTDYMRWQECPKNAWLAIHKPDFYYSFEPSEFELALRETGEKVEGIARGLSLMECSSKVVTKRHRS